MIALFRDFFVLFYFDDYYYSIHSFISIFSQESPVTTSWLNWTVDPTYAYG